MTQKGKERNVQIQEEQQLAVLSQYRGMVMKLAWSYWYRLPASTKLWVDPEDLIEEAYIFVLRTAANQHKANYDSKKSSLSNFTWCGVSNLLLNFALSQQTAKRFGWMTSLEAAIAIGKRDSEMDCVVAMEALKHVIEGASPKLRIEILKWFGPQAPRVRRSSAAQELYREFYELANKNSLSANDCRRLFGRVFAWA